MRFPTATPNQKCLAGQFASEKVLFGEFSRFALVAVHTRFEAVQWFVFDAEKVDDLGLTAVVAQADNPSDAVKRFI